MVFGGKKFERWKQQNPEILSNIISQSDGDANVVERLLNNETNGQFRKEIREFMIKAYESGYFRKGTEEIQKAKEKKKNEQEMRKRYAWWQWQQQQQQNQRRYFR